jgi:hypothetical protein
VKEDLGFGQTGEKTEKITIAEYDMRAAKKEIQKVLNHYISLKLFFSLI